MGAQLIPADFSGIRILLSSYLETDRGEHRDGEKPSFFFPFFFKACLEFEWISILCSSSNVHLSEKLKDYGAGLAVMDALPG